MNQRIYWADWTKVVCIVLMVCLHYGVPEWMQTFGYTFHMPVLFMVSGFLFKKHSFVRNLFSLVLPVLFFSFVNLAVRIVLMAYHGFTFDFTNICWIQYCLNWDKSPLFGGVWFIWALLGLKIIYCNLGLVSDFIIKYNNYVLLFSIIALTMAYTLGYNGSYYLIGKTLPALPFFAFGFVFRKYHNRLPDIDWKILCLLSCFAIVLAYYGSGSLLLEDFTFYPYYWFRAVLFCIILYYAFRNLEPSSFIITLSKGTYVIFGLHMTMLRLVYYEFFPGKLYSTLFIWGTILTLYISYKFTCWSLKNCPYVLGKSITKY